MLFDFKFVGKILPQNKDARVAVIGAGPSGILIAEHLVTLGYTGVNILEKTGRYGGMTHTVTIPIETKATNHPPETVLPKSTITAVEETMTKEYSDHLKELIAKIEQDPLDCPFLPELSQLSKAHLGAKLHKPKKHIHHHHEKKNVKQEEKSEVNTKVYVPCELGTCYLSPAYSPIRDLLKKYDPENKEVPFDDSRGVVNWHPKTVQDKINGIAFDLYCSEYVIGDNPSLGAQLTEYKDVLELLKKYAKLHKSIMGPVAPFSYNRHSERFETLAMPFMDFITQNKLGRLLPFILYGYEAQGYGPLDKISTFYGLMWLTPIVTTTVYWKFLGKLLDKIPVLDHHKPQKLDKPVVTYLIKGWLSLWDKIVETQKFKILLNVNIVKIKR